MRRWNDAKKQRYERGSIGRDSTYLRPISPWRASRELFCWRARELAHTHSFFTSFFAPNGDKPAMNTPSSALSPGSSLGASRRQSVGSEGERYAEKWRLHPTRTHRVAQSKPADFCTRTAVLRARTSYFRVAVVLRCGLQYMYR